MSYFVELTKNAPLLLGNDFFVKLVKKFENGESVDTPYVVAPQRNGYTYFIYMNKGGLLSSLQLLASVKRLHN